MHESSEPYPLLQSFSNNTNQNNLFPSPSAAPLSPLSCNTSLTAHSHHDMIQSYSTTLPKQIHVLQTLTKSPFTQLGIKMGEAHIIRNAGGMASVYPSLFLYLSADVSCLSAEMLFVRSSFPNVSLVPVKSQSITIPDVGWLRSQNLT